MPNVPRGSAVTHLRVLRTLCDGAEQRRMIVDTIALVRGCDERHSRFDAAACCRWEAD
jgi:hypothetical protein